MNDATITASSSFNRQPLLWLAVCFALGITLAKFTPVAFLPSLIVCLVAATLALAFRNKSVATGLAFLAFAAAGAASFQAESSSIRSDRLRVLYDTSVIESGEPVEIEGVLAGRPEPAVEGYFLTVRSDRLRYRGDERIVSGNARLFVPQPGDSKFEISNFKYGSRIRVACRLEREDKFLNPGVISRREILDRLGVDATASVKSTLLIDRVADESVFIPLAWVYDQRAKLIDAFRDNLSPTAAGVMIASLLGNKHFLDKDTADLFREGGTFHILVISGLHITFIGGLIYWLLRQLTRRRTIQFVVTNSILWAYTLAVGADVPVVRAAIMFTVISFSYVIYRQSILLNSLGLGALILLVWRPSDLFNPSFQLTFVSVGAIVACAYPLIRNLRAIGEWTPSANTPFPANVPKWLRRFCETIYWRDDAWRVESKRNLWTANLFKSPYVPHRMIYLFQTAARYLLEGLLVSLIVQIWMLPLTVVYFHRVSLISILLNLWVGLFIALESFAAIAGAFAAYFSALLAAGFFALAEAFNWLMLLVPRLFADNGWVSFRLPAYIGVGQVVYFLYFVPILLLAVAVVRWKPFDLRSAHYTSRRFLVPTGAASIILGGVIIFHPFSAPKADGRLQVDFLDVGQGDSIFISFPNGQTMLVDGGGRFDYRDDESNGERFEPDIRGVGDAVVSEVLWANGYSRIDHILATHAHADHIGGLKDVAKNFSIGSAIIGGTPQADPYFAALAEVLNRRGIPVETVERGDVLKFGEVTVEVLYPKATEDLLSASDNDNSIVIRVVYGSRMFLLTGDIERNAEAELLGSGTLTADVVKVAHHGSRTSSTEEFVNASNAAYAIISAPRRSPFGHPHREIVERWKASGADVLTTGDGMISVSTDGKDLRVSRFVRSQ